MAADAHAAADFYATPRGAVAARLLRERLVAMWPDLHGQSESMRYALEMGGKRVRPVIGLATGEACGVGNPPVPNKCGKGTQMCIPETCGRCLMAAAARSVAPAVASTSETKRRNRSTRCSSLGP